jgi:nitrogen regulatory protein P-II 1
LKKIHLRKGLSMLSIEAIIKPERVNQVVAALEAVGCKGFYYFNVTGQGGQGGVEVLVGRGGRTAGRSAVPKTLVRTIIDESMKDSVVEAIIGSARSPGEGAIGDGKIFITEIQEAIRVRTGEKGIDAI